MLSFDGVFFLFAFFSLQGPPGPQGPLGYPGPRGVKVRRTQVSMENSSSPACAGDGPCQQAQTPSRGAQGRLTNQPYLLLKQALVQRLLSGHEDYKSQLCSNPPSLGEISLLILREHGSVPF